MKPIYRIFSRVLFLNIIAISMVIFTVQMTVVIVIDVANGHIDYFASICFFLLLLFDIWLLTSTLLPIIKINGKGIFAYSLFWKRYIKWEDIKSARLMKMRTGNNGTGTAGVGFELTNVPEKKPNAFLNKGIRVATFIVVSNENIKTLKPLSLSASLLSHSKMTKKHEIAFEYEEKAWRVIREKIGG